MSLNIKIFASQLNSSGKAASDFTEQIEGWSNMMLKNECKLIKITATETVRGDRDWIMNVLYTFSYHYKKEILVEKVKKKKKKKKPTPVANPLDGINHFFDILGERDPMINQRDMDRILNDLVDEARREQRARRIDEITGLRGIM